MITSLPASGTLLVVDDEPSSRQALATLLREEGHQVHVAADGYKALGIFGAHQLDLVLTDVKMPLMDGLELIRQIKAKSPRTSCVVMTAFGSIENAVAAMNQGADDYLTKPLNFDAVNHVVHRALARVQLEREVDALRAAADGGTKGFEMIGHSEALERTQRLIEQVAPSTATILISGESGTGKELAARAIHELSGRAKKPMVTLHCASLPESLLESELFGHEKGAFTGAIKTHTGHLERAHEGTLFLDEVGEISPAIQVKMLRFLQTQEIQRVGGERTLRLDVRVLTATNRSLEEEVRAGRFREDLYYRLNIINVEMPPLRDRPEDLDVLAHYFAQKFAAKNEKTISRISRDFLLGLKHHHWPGNIRELENVLERAVVLCMGDSIEAEHLPHGLGPESWRHDELQVPGMTLAQVERHVILSTYKACEGDTGRTAQMLDISRRKVQYRLRAYGAQKAPQGPSEP